MGFTLTAVLCLFSLLAVRNIALPFAEVNPQPAMSTAASISSDLTSTSTTPWAKLHRNLRILVTAPLRDLVPAQYIFDRRITKAGHTWITQNFVRRVLVKPDMTVEDVPRTLTQIPPEAILRVCRPAVSIRIDYGKLIHHLI